MFVERNAPPPTIKKGLASRSCVSKCILTFLTIPRTSMKFDTQWEKGEDPRIVVWIYL